MKFTLDQIKAIIAEEVANVTKEAKVYTPGGKDDPFNQKYEDDPVLRSDKGANDEGHFDSDTSGADSRSADPNEDKDWEVGTFFHVVEKFLKDRGYEDFRLSDMDNEHVKELNAAMNPDDEAHKTLMDAIKWSHKYTEPGWALTITPERFKSHMDLLNREDRGLKWFDYRVGMLGR